jgi:quercetin dioxygenase-like cupin family protein
LKDDSAPITRRKLLAWSAKAFTFVAGGIAAREMFDIAAYAIMLKTTGRTAEMEITRSGSQPSAKGPEQYFAGSVRIDAPSKGTGQSRVGGATVTFEPSAHTAWHTNPLGQTLLVSAGSGRVQREGGPIESICPGDIVWFAPGEKHWVPRPIAR